MVERTSLARSPVTVAGPTAAIGGWEVSLAATDAPLSLADWTATAKVLVRADPHGTMAAALGVGHGTARRDPHGALVVGTRPGEWLAFAAPGTVPEVLDRLEGLAEGDFATILDVTSGRAVFRLTGLRAAALLAKACALDLEVAPDGSAYCSSLARVAAEIVRDDRPTSGGPRPSYLLACERSYGCYLFDALLDVGREFGVEPAGYHP